MKRLSSSQSMLELTPSQYRQYQQRDKLFIQQAIKLIQSQGLVSFKFSQLAKSVSCSPSTLYRHFSNKEDILIAIYSDLLEQLLAYQPEVINAPLNTAERWVALQLFAIEATQHLPWAQGLNVITGINAVTSHANDYRKQKLAMHQQLFYNNVLRMVEAARLSGELITTREELDDIHTLLSYLQVGASATYKNQLHSQLSSADSSTQLYQGIACMINSLDWKVGLKPESYQLIMSSLDNVKLKIKQNHDQIQNEEQ